MKAEINAVDEATSVRRVAGGDRVAFDELDLRRSPRLVTRLHRRCSDDELDTAAAAMVARRSEDDRHLSSRQ